MLNPWQTGKIIRIEQEASQTRRFWIEIPGAKSFDFKPGQFVTLDLPIHEKLNKRIRSYSISSWPDGSNVIELVIVLLEGGAGTNYLFNQCDVGSDLTLRGPQGVFTLPEQIDKDLFFICTGTGIAPFRSMTHHLSENPVPHRNIYLIFGCRQFGDCLYRKELEDLSGRLEGFQYIPTFSREKADPANPGFRTGYVHAIYEEICKAGAQSAAAEDGGDGAKQLMKPASFFLCGWKNMIDEAKQRIQALGYDRKSIHQELYG
jgi:ferredoxin-NADP reductase